MSPNIKNSLDEGPKRRVLVGAIGACVHNLGVEGFADWMADQELGYISVKLGPAVPIPEVINKIRVSDQKQGPHFFIAFDVYLCPQNK